MTVIEKINKRIADLQIHKEECNNNLKFAQPSEAKILKKDISITNRVIKELHCLLLDL